MITFSTLEDGMENDRDCEHCKHHIKTYIKGLEVYQCEKWNCEYEPHETAKRAIMHVCRVKKEEKWTIKTIAVG